VTYNLHRSTRRCDINTVNRDYDNATWRKGRSPEKWSPE